MRIVFAGTSAFAVPSLRALVDLCYQSTAYELVGVYTQPDRPSGRGRQMTKGSLKALAEMANLPVYQPLSLKNEASQQSIRDLHPDLMVVASYGLLLPPSVLNIPRFGCINVHASLLPRWRGAAPIQYALLSGDVVTGVTIMQMDVGLDTGNVLYQKEEKIQDQDTAVDLELRVSLLGAEALMDTLQALTVLQQRQQPQSSEGICYAPKLTKEAGWIDWHQPAIELERQIRATNPWPVSFTNANGQRLRVWKALAHPDQSCANVAVGTILAIGKHAIQISTAKGILDLLELQCDGGRRLPVTSLINGSLKHLCVGMRLNVDEKNRL